MSTTWHRLEESDEGDDQCVRCHIVIDPLAEQTFTLLCPQPPCPSPKNPDDGCVFVPGRGEVCHCLYCGKPGGKVAAEPDDEIAVEPQ